MVIGRDELLGFDRQQRDPRPSDTVIPALIQAVLANVHTGIAEGTLQAAASYTRERGRPWPKFGVNKASEDAYILLE